MLGRCFGDSQKMLRRYLGNAQEILRRSIEHARDMLGTCSGHARDMLGTCSGHAQEISKIRSKFYNRTQLFQTPSLSSIDLSCTTLIRYARVICLLWHALNTDVVCAPFGILNHVS